MKNFYKDILNIKHSVELIEKCNINFEPILQEAFDSFNMFLSTVKLDSKALRLLKLYDKFVELHDRPSRDVFIEEFYDVALQQGYSIAEIVIINQDAAILASSFYCLKRLATSYNPNKYKPIFFTNEDWLN